MRTQLGSVLRFSVIRSWALGSVALVAVLLGSVSQASALGFVLAGDANGQDVIAGDQVTMTVSIAGEGTLGIVTLSVGVLFDDARLSYNQGASSTSSYTLYHVVLNPKTGAQSPGTYLNAATTCGGDFYSPSAGAGCALRVGQTNQVNVDFISTGFPSTGTTGQQQAIELMATLVFDVIGTPGLANISLSLTSPGNVIGNSSGVSIPATLAGSGSVNVIPEPTTALLVGLGLAGLGIAGRRQS